MKSQTFQAQASIRLRPHTILIVEDKHEISDLLMAFFTQETPYWVFAVADAAQALEAVKAIIPTLFILDYGLPGVNGLELHDLLHSITGLETVPTLMVSAHLPSRQAMRDRQITYLPEPLDLAILLSVITNLLPQQHG